MARRSNPMKILYLDIETAPADAKIFSLRQRYINPKYITSPGYTLCWAAKWEGQREIIYSGLHNNTVENMLHKMHELLMEADAVVHYNGRKFDMPTLNREFIKMGLPPVTHYHQIDLLKTVRAQFRFESNKLDYVCQLLGLGAKVQHKGIQLWYDCMADDAAAWKHMEKYNRQDVKLLPILYHRLLPWITDHPNVGLWKSRIRRTCAQCGSTKLKSLDTTFKSKALEYEAFLCGVCSTPLRAGESLNSAGKNLTQRIPR